MKCSRCGNEHSQNGICEKCNAFQNSQSLPSKQKERISVYKILLSVLVIVIALASAATFTKRLFSHKESPEIIASCLLDPPSSLDKRYQYASDAIRYAVIYHNAFLKNKVPLLIEKLEINDKGDLDLEIKRGQEHFRFDEHLRYHLLEDVLIKVMKMVVPSRPAHRIDQPTIDKLNMYLDSSNQFDYVRALRMIQTALNGSQYPNPALLAKAARAYLSISLVNQHSSVSSFYDDLISRSFGLLALSSLEQPVPTEDYYYIKSMLSYLSGNPKKSFEIASTPDAKKENRSRIFLTIKKPEAVSSNDHPFSIIYWKLIFSGREGFEINGEVMEKLAENNSDNLFILSWLARKSVGEGRIYGPVLIEKTLQEHLSFIKDEYPDWAAKLQKQYDLFHKKDSNTISSQFQRLLRLIEKSPENKTPQHILPGYETIEKVSQALFRGKSHSLKLDADLFSEEDERRFFYHSLLTAISIWQDLLRVRWCVLDYAVRSSDDLNEIFNDPFITLLHAEVLQKKDKSVERPYHMMAKLIHATGDRAFLLRILGVGQFTKWQAAKTGPLMKKLALRFQENGRFLNALGNVAVLKDKARLSFLEEGIKRDPWNVSAVYGLSWENNDLSLMKRLIRDLPGNAKVFYKAGYIAYKRFGDISTATEYMKRALKIQPSSYDAAIFLGMLLRNEGKHEEAIKVYEKYLQVDSESLSGVDMKNMIGYTLLSLKKTDEAIRIFSETAETYKASSMRGAVETYLAAGENEKAELWAKRLVERYNDNYAMNTLCRLYYRTGERKKLDQAIDQYTKLYPIYSKSLAAGWNARLTHPELFRKKLGAMILFVMRETSGFDAGLKNGDIVLSYNDIAMDSGFDFSYYSYPRNKHKVLTVLREGSIIKLPIQDEPWSEFER
jgi:tetratricopeptide (TPR) repeat protein